MRRPFIVADMSANHLGSIERALDIVDAAARAGADAVKTQCYRPDHMADPETVVEIGPWVGRKARDLYREAWTPFEFHRLVFERARGLGMIGFASVFHPHDVDYLESKGCLMYKISSFELLDLPLIRRAAATHKPLIISTGMGTTEEIYAAAVAARSAGCRNLTFLKCTSAYPADPADANLVTMMSIAGLTQADTGLSDHTPGIGVAVAAAALGAAVIEKHLTLARGDGGPDADFSLEPAEFTQLVTECRRAAAAIGEIRYGPTPAETASALLRRKPGGNRGE